MTESNQSTEAGLETELVAWLKENWDPEITVAEWWERLGTSGWAAPSWPAKWYGQDLSPSEAVRAQQIIAEFGALGPPGGLGLLLAGPTIAVQGTDEQRDRYLRDIVTGQKAWCQLFSEPGAGSDLAGLSTSAVRDGDQWIVNGQKVWTSTGTTADLGMLLARTDPDVPKHQGITYFAVDMHQPGVEVRPLREMTGRALFNEVFLTDVVVDDDAAIGGVNNGWAVANTTLGFERSGLGAGGGSAAGGRAGPGTVTGDLDRRAGDFTEKRGRRAGGGGMGFVGYDTLVALATANGTIADASVRQDLTRLFSLYEIAKYTRLRQKALAGRGGSVPGLGNIAKLSMSDILRRTRDLGLQILGARGMLHGYHPAEAEALADRDGNQLAVGVTEAALFAQGPSIYGGTDEIQHNILGERVLGLPREPSNDRSTPFRELPRNG
ncbi:MAG TPA: acyl-CoA dehydrogenase family protein [Acidimicrobiales bacterium]|nr:acyl-CoA dehydrogenase family protein [Acidimicrobiales bacterium]